MPCHSLFPHPTPLPEGEGVNRAAAKGSDRFPPLRRLFRALATTLTFILLLLGGNLLAAQEVESPPAEDDGQQAVSAGADEESAIYAGTIVFSEGVRGYYHGGRVIGTPTDVETDLARSFPKRDSILPRVIPEGWFQWKEDLYEKHGLQMSMSYQSLFQSTSASKTRTGVGAAWMGWALLEAEWEIFNRDEDYQGGVVAALDWRHTLGGKAVPAFWGNTDVGSQWPTDFAYIEWDPWLPVLYWQQWFKQDVFVLRVGNQVVNHILDFMRFKDPRVAFSGSPLTAPAGSMPFPGPGFSASFKWWPVEDEKLYVVGTANDQNFETEDLTWGNALSEGDFFYALEVGNNWGRGKGDFDHLHLNLFYGDAPAEPGLPGAPNEPGWGFKVYGEKQVDRVVGFGGYTYNTAEGGPFGITLAKHNVTAGAALVKPFGIRGEMAVGTSWSQPINEDLNSQYSVEAYWKILLFPSMWLTPGVQFIFDPTFNPEQDQITVGQLKFRVFF